jgi:probable phosphoglycerate mutase
MIYAARHGETSWNIERRILGSAPGTLTHKGLAQAHELADRIAHLQPGRLLASDLSHIITSLRPTRQRCPQVPVHFTPQLQERHFGELQGQRFDTVEWRGFWELPPNQTMYGVESLDVFTRRIARVVEMLAQYPADEDIVLVTHSGVMNRLQYLTNPGRYRFMSYPPAELFPFNLQAMLRHGRKLLPSLV